ncbi:MarC family protein [Egbenema bharatensis]|uniref:MarC family protein n=1 Tax=Egbenema bharatensis TaxID=3463334 RepID=UPI003A89F6C8
MSRLAIFWRSFYNSVLCGNFCRSKLARRGISVLAVFLLTCSLHLPFPNLATAQIDAVACSIATDTQQCYASEGLTSSPIAQAPDPTAPIPPASEPVILPKQRIADRIARTPIDAPLGIFNLFIVFFVTLGPLKVIPSFVQLTQKADPLLRRQLAFRSAALATIVILVVALIGQNMVRVWQIRLPALLIAGGILLFLVALNMVMIQYQRLPLPEESSPPSLDLVVAPLTFPTILPPFGIAIALVLMLISQEIGFNSLVVLGVLVLVMLLNLVGMLAARPILTFLRPITLRIFGFVLGVLQLALGIEWIITGLEIEALVFRRLFGF